jgi:hypothetical protein
MTKGKATLLAAAVAFVGAFLPTIIALKMLADNNNNGELYDTITGRWDVGHALSFSAAFFIPSFLIIFAITYGLVRHWGDPADDL